MAYEKLVIATGARGCVALESAPRAGASFRVFLPEEPTWADVQAAMRLMPNPKGDTLPIDILMDRIDGKPVQKVELKGNQPHSFDEIPTDMIMGMLAGTVEIPEHLLSLGESGSGRESDKDA